MNLIEYFLNNFDKFENHKWYKEEQIKLLLLNNQKMITHNCSFIIKNKDYAFNIFKKLLEPNTNNITKEKNILYILLLFYFEIKGLEIPDLNNYFENPIDYSNIDNALVSIILYIRDEKLKGETNYKIRRNYNSNLKLVEKSNNLLNEKLFSYIEIKKLSTSDKKFSLLEKREKLETLVKTIENLLKKPSGDFININENLLLNILNNEMIKKYRQQNWFIRHGNEDALSEGKKLSEDELDFLIDFGIVICGRIYHLKENSKI